MLFKFVCVGLVATLIDACSYNYLTHYVNMILAKGIAFELSVVVNFLISAFWSFQSSFPNLLKQLWRFSKLYTFSALFNMLSNFGIFHLLLQAHVLPKNKVTVLSCLLATVLTASVNYLGQTLWVFKSNPVLKSA